jgi:hypothetical protein
VAGAGKSSLTLRLCAQLIREGLHPIRVRLRDLGTEGELLDALASAVALHDERRHPGGPRYGRPEDLFLNGRIFDETIKFRGCAICPYVLILDGWDELTVSSSEDFRKRLEGVLEKVRSRFLGATRGVRVRVVITGRPSVAVADARFMKNTTPLLTIRPLTPIQLTQYISRLHAAQARPHGDRQPMWRLGDIDRYDGIIEHYKESCQRNEDHVLGHPLLAYVALRVIANQEGDLSAIVSNSTDLYRTLVDMTCARAGKSSFDEEDEPQVAKIAGAELRRLLRITAGAISNLGGESISYDELSLRLKQGGMSLEHIDEMEDHNVLTKLMISFYFRGGSRDLGCEFAHKSFREYLFAEHIVETIKHCAALENALAAPRHDNEIYRDFYPNELQFELSRRLSMLLSARWLEPEVSLHLSRLLEWEITERTSGVLQEGAISTERIDANDWATIRDGLADVWDWWVMGVHLRPRIKLNRYQAEEVEPSFANELVRLAAPLHIDRRESERLVLDDMASIDARLGDGLFRIAMMVHYNLAVAMGWLSSADSAALDFAERLWRNTAERGLGVRRRQCMVSKFEGADWILFSPEVTPGEWSHIESRINAAKDRPVGLFPVGIRIVGADFRNVAMKTSLVMVSAKVRSLPILYFVHCNLSYSHVHHSRSLALDCVYAQGARFYKSYLQHAKRCCLRQARMHDMIFRVFQCDLRDAVVAVRFFDGEQRDRLKGCLTDGMRFDIGHLLVPAGKRNRGPRDLVLSLDEWDTLVTRVRQWQEQDPFLLEIKNRMTNLTGTTTKADVELASQASGEAPDD